ncbi:predicted protein [Phaeodactylum tricornutum CCAP 1055/1]|uniref:Uncharacterized protein n=3 Tax=Phaeodactylum tricornutum TaxID=2850 RepID=B7G8V4_PHATC|nr:predicted protein [Phaeodactylum tricornutum CCAP 1055/1]EEC44839.1 predicted protein [Phaeodactylum tricornutum CCAP 1055/1]|eukprot:XP_002183657.1 predicted protein [Phaeodactylum tricornutum CCAP 1055/1]
MITTTETVASPEPASFLTTSGALTATPQNEECIKKRSPAEAAAAARRKRRRALVRRTHSPKNVPTRHCGSSSPLSPNRKPTLIQATVEGIREISVRWTRGDTVAIPTEYPGEWSERIRRLQGSDLCRCPHVLVPSSLDVPFLKKMLPPRPYAMRGKDGVANSVHAFSESQQVLQRLATRIWPGPVNIHVAVVDENADCSGLYSSRDGKKYLTLRSPGHPLAVKALLEQVRVDDSSVLVGLPLYHDSGAPCTAAMNVASRLFEEHDENNSRPWPSAVLNGEERREIFAVPTCEHGRVWPISLWIDASRRLVTIRGQDPGVNSTTMPLSPQNVMSSLYSTSHRRNSGLSDKSMKELLIQAVVRKWKVVEELT